MTSNAPRNSTPPQAGPGFEDGGGRFRRTLVRVMTVQVAALLLLWLLQATYSS